MKVFVAQDLEKGYVSTDNYHWCDSNDLLMFGQFQLGNGNPREVSMCGIKSRCVTTYIIVKDLNIDREFYKEMIIESVEGGLECTVDKDGDYDVNIAWGFHFNINDIVDELLEKASAFEDGQKLKCRGRDLFKV